MKQVAQNYRSGSLTVLEAPAPSCAPGGVLVRSLYSLISTGTELMKVGEAKMSLLGMARARPDQVKKVLDAMYQQGAMATYRKTMNRLDAYTPLGYSLAGVVTDVGAGAEQLSVGQLVACAGNEHALHAELNWVPVNLCVPVPDRVAPQLAAFATVGAIALHGVRQAEVQLGDTACVVGLGLVGQLVVQLLVAAGAAVVGLDVVAERCRLAERTGALLCAAPDEDGLAAVEAALSRASGGLGADRVLLAAGGSSTGPVEAAARLARDRAKVVDIGKCHLDLPWNAYYEKELDVRFSRSYGPGRYDPRYEIDGVDYPAGYVRWTERRNLACFLELAAEGRIDLEPLVSGVFPLADAPDVYERLRSGSLPGVGFLFEYPPAPPAATAEANGAEHPTVAVAEETPTPPAAGRRHRPSRGALRLGFIGAGSYASSMLLPHLARRPGIELARVATRRSLSAVNAGRRFGFGEAGTDVDAVLEDEGIDAVFIVTRHSSHAELTCRALRAGKAVFVEKPLALRAEELDRVLAAVDESGNDRLMVGFNRRFSPMLAEAKARFARARGPVVAHYRVNAGRLAANSWYRDEELEGSRFAGEGGHFIDTLSWWVDADPLEVFARQVGADGSLQVSLRYANGSLATVTYTTTGHPRFPKEALEVSGEGRSAQLDNFRRATVWSGHRRRVRRSLSSPDKGQGALLEALLAALRRDGPMPIALASLAATTRATLAVGASLASGRPERV